MTTQSITRDVLRQQASIPAPTRKILRYRRAPRLIHALLALSFLILLITGLALIWSPLAGLAAGGYSRLLHRLGAILFMAVPVVYLIVDRPGAKELLWDSFHYDQDDRHWLACSYRYFMGYCENMPPQGRHNAGQKLHHAGVVIFSATIVASGLALWFGREALGLNGLAVAAIIHDLSMLILTILLVGHLYFTFVYDALSGMTEGYITEEAARLEHAKWVEALPQEAPWVVTADQAKEDQPVLADKETETIEEA